MPKFDANLTFLFNELPFLDRFAAARKSGFLGVEYMSPYEDAEDGDRRASEGTMACPKCCSLTLPVGDLEGKGERGIAILP